MMLKLLCLFLSASFAIGETITFSGHTWKVRGAAKGGPGPNFWSPRNVSLDSKGRLHLKITEKEDKWFCSEVSTQKRLGFGTYRFVIEGPISTLDPNIVLGLFNYPPADVGPGMTHEIDIEFAKWGDPKGKNSTYPVWPAEAGLKQTSHPFDSKTTGPVTTHQFTWTPTEIHYQSFDSPTPDPKKRYAEWRYQPKSSKKRIAQKAMPVHLNLWCFRGQAPTDKKGVEFIIHSFNFSPIESPKK